MNEQEMADLFSAQIDRVLGGESAIDLAVESDLPLLALGQQLSQVSFQASPTAQAAFQSQLAGWFGATGGSKTLLLSLGAALVIMSAGLALVVLLSFIWAGALFTPADNSRPGPGVSPSALPGRPGLASPEVAHTPTSVPTRPQGNSSLGDALPTVTTAVGDTILLPTTTPTPTPVKAATTGTPAANPAGADDSDASPDTLPPGDHDRGHGNDPDGYDSDNPGQSGGVSGGNDSNSPGGLTGGSGGNDSSGSGNKDGGQGGNGGGHGGGKGNN